MENYYDPFNKFEDMKTKFCKYYVRAIPYRANFFDPINHTADISTFCNYKSRKLDSVCRTYIGCARYFGDLNNHNSNWQKLVFLTPDISDISDLITNGGITYDQ